MEILFKLLVTYSIFSMAGGGILMFLDTAGGFRSDCEKAVAVLWLGPVVVWGFIFSVAILTKVWA